MAHVRVIGYCRNTVPAKGKILIVEDDAKTSASLALYLRHAGYDVCEEADGDGALARAAVWQPDLLILDVMLPGTNGIEVCKALRRLGEVSIIMLTARAGEQDKLVGLESGADDYVTKPFSPRELVARVAAVLRRGKPKAAVVRIGEIEIDTSLKLVRRAGEAVPLTTAEFRLLEAMAASPERAFTRAELAERAFGHDHDALERTIDVHVKNLRRKLDPDRGRRTSVIATVFGTGYRLQGAISGS